MLTTGFDATLIPGGGLRGVAVAPWVKVRLDWAISRYSGEYLIPLSAGTVHRPPPLEIGGFPLLESVAAARYLLAQGIPAERILPETLSLDTIGNAYFARRLHVDPLGFRDLQIVTSTFHMPRTQAIFEWMFSLNAPPGNYRLSFKATPDEGLDTSALAKRKAREQASLSTVEQLRNRLTSLSDLHHWLYTQHQAYAISLTPIRATDANLDTY